MLPFYIGDIVTCMLHSGSCSCSVHTMQGHSQDLEEGEAE